MTKRLKNAEDFQELSGILASYASELSNVARRMKKASLPEITVNIDQLIRIVEKDLAKRMDRLRPEVEDAFRDVKSGVERD